MIINTGKFTGLILSLLVVSSCGNTKENRSVSTGIAVHDEANAEIIYLYRIQNTLLERRACKRKSVVFDLTTCKDETVSVNLENFIKQLGTLRPEGIKTLEKETELLLLKLAQTDAKLFEMIGLGGGDISASESLLQEITELEAERAALNVEIKELDVQLQLIISKGEDVFNQQISVIKDELLVKGKAKLAIDQSIDKLRQKHIDMHSHLVTDHVFNGLNVQRNELLRKISLKREELMGKLALDAAFFRTINMLKEDAFTYEFIDDLVLFPHELHYVSKFAEIFKSIHLNELMNSPDERLKAFSGAVTTCNNASTSIKLQNTVKFLYNRFNVRNCEALANHLVDMEEFYFYYNSDDVDRQDYDYSIYQFMYKLRKISGAFMVYDWIFAGNLRFLERVDFTGGGKIGDAYKNLDALLLNPALQEIHLRTGTDVLDVSFQGKPQIKALSVDCYNGSFDWEVIAKFPNLKYLRIDECTEFQNTRENVIRHIDLSMFELDSGYRSMSEFEDEIVLPLQSQENLKILALSGRHIEPKKLASLSRLSLQNLEQFLYSFSSRNIFYNIGKGDNFKIAAPFSEAISEERPNPEDLASPDDFAFLSELKKLKAAYFGGAQLDHLNFLKDSTTTINKLFIAGFKENPGDIEALQDDLLRFTEVEDLGLISMGINRKHIDSLFRKFPKLKNLHLQSNENLNDLSGIADMQLESLSVTKKFLDKLNCPFTDEKICKF